MEEKKSKFIRKDDFPEDWPDDLMRQSDFARDIGVSPQYINNLMRKNLIKGFSDLNTGKRLISRKQARDAIAQARQPGRTLRRKKRESNDIEAQRDLLREKKIDFDLAAPTTSEEIAVEIAKAKLEKEQQLALSTRLKNMEFLNELVPKEEVVHHARNTAKLTSQRIMALIETIPAAVKSAQTPQEEKLAVRGLLSEALKGLRNEYNDFAVE